MAARAGMANLILRLRSMTNTSATDYSINGTTYWVDDQLESYLDNYRNDIRYMTLVPNADYGASNTVTYTEYLYSVKNVETADTSGVFVLQDLDYNVISSGFTVDYNAAKIIFGSDTSGDAYLLTFRSYDLNAAASDVWREIAAHSASRFDVSTPDHDLKLSQIRKHAIEMSQYYRNMSSTTGFKTLRMVRSDVNY